jgi:predicted N-acetyltransferase YhbS
MTPTIRPMLAADHAAAEQVMREAFSHEFNLPDPASFRGDAALIPPRVVAHPGLAFVADAAGALLGSIILMDWGSAIIVGPLTVRPDNWGGGIARDLLATALAASDQRAPRLTGLFTDPSSTRHLRLYEAFGFTAQRLVAVMARPTPTDTAMPAGVRHVSTLPPGDRADAVLVCRTITDALFAGLDLGIEITALLASGLGDVLLTGDGRGFAICHHGAGSEAGSSSLFVKFAAVRPNDSAGFAELLGAIEAHAAALGTSRIELGTNHGRTQAYAMLKQRGFRSWMSGVAMHRPDQPGYAGPADLVIEDWR